MAVSKIWVFAEADGDKPAGATLEILTKARELAGTVEAVYVGTNADALAGELGATAPPRCMRSTPATASPASSAQRRSPR